MWTILLTFPGALLACISQISAAILAGVLNVPEGFNIIIQYLQLKFNSIVRGLNFCFSCSKSNTNCHCILTKKNLIWKDKLLSLWHQNVSVVLSARQIHVKFCISPFMTSSCRLFLLRDEKNNNKKIELPLLIKINHTIISFPTLFYTLTNIPEMLHQRGQRSFNHSSVMSAQLEHL